MFFIISASSKQSSKEVVETNLNLSLSTERKEQSATRLTLFSKVSL